jgi:hypothetical protein
MYDDPQIQELHSRFVEWSFTRQANGQAYLPSTDKANFEKLAARAQQLGGIEALSAWDRAALEIGIKLRQPPVAAVPIPADFEAQINSMSSTELRKRLNRDPVFAEMFGRVSAGEKPEGVTVSDAYELTAAQWRSLPPDVASRKMSDPKFRAAVDRLIQRGEI